MADIDFTGFDEIKSGNTSSSSNIDFTGFDEIRGPKKVGLVDNAIGMLDAAAVLGSQAVYAPASFLGSIVASLAGGNELQGKFDQAAAMFPFQPGEVTGSKESEKFVRPVEGFFDAVIGSKVKKTKEVVEDLMKNQAMGSPPSLGTIDESLNTAIAERGSTLVSKSLEALMFGLGMKGVHSGFKGAIRRLKSEKLGTGDVDIIANTLNEMRNQGVPVETFLEQSGLTEHPIIKEIEARNAETTARKNAEAKSAFEKSRNIFNDIETVKEQPVEPSWFLEKKDETMVQKVPQLEKPQTKEQIIAEQNTVKVEDALDSPAKTMGEELARRNESERVRKNAEAKAAVSKQQELAQMLKGLQKEAESSSLPEDLYRITAEDLKGLSPEDLKFLEDKIGRKTEMWRIEDEIKGDSGVGETVVQIVPELVKHGVEKVEGVKVADIINLPERKRVKNIQEKIENLKSSHPSGSSDLSQARQQVQKKLMTTEFPRPENLGDISFSSPEYLEGVKKFEERNKKTTEIKTSQEKIEGMILPDEKFPWFSTSEKASAEFDLNKRSFKNAENAQKFLVSREEFSEVVKVGDKYRVAKKRVEDESFGSQFPDEMDSGRRTELELLAREGQMLASGKDVDLQKPKVREMDLENQLRNELQPRVVEWLKSDGSASIEPIENLARAIGEDLKMFSNDHPLQSGIDRMLEAIYEKKVQAGKAERFNPDRGEFPLDVDEVREKVVVENPEVQKVTQSEIATSDPIISKAVSEHQWTGDSVGDIKSLFKKIKDLTGDERGSFSWKDLPGEKAKQISDVVEKIKRTGKDVVRELMSYGFTKEEATQLIRDIDANVPKTKTKPASLEEAKLWKRNRSDKETNRIVNAEMNPEIITADQVHQGSMVSRPRKDIVYKYQGPEGKEFEFTRKKVNVYEGGLELIKNTANITNRVLKTFGVETAARMWDRVDPTGRGLSYFHNKEIKARKVVLERQRAEKSFLGRQIRDAGGRKGMIKVGTYWRGQEYGGPEFIKSLGIKPVLWEDLSPKQQQVFNTMKSRMDSFWLETNQRRALMDLAPMKYVNNYMAQARTIDIFGNEINLTNMKGMGEFQRKIQSVNEMSIPFARTRNLIGGGKRSLDAGYLYERYTNKVIEAMEKSEVITELKAMMRELKDPESGKRFKLATEKPNLAQFISSYINQVAGVSNWKLPGVVETPMKIISKNIPTALLSYSFRFGAVQLSQIANTWHGAGSKYLGLAIKNSMLHPVETFKRGMSGAHLPDRLMNTNDVTLREITNIIGNGPIKTTNRMLSQVGFALGRAVDFEIANLSFEASYLKGRKEFKMSHERALEYADRKTIDYNGSSAPGDISPLQSSVAGKFLTILGTFNINDFGYIAREVAGTGNVRMNKLDRVKSLIKYAAIIYMVNTIDRNILGIKPGHPEPLQAMLDEIEDGGDISDAMIESFYEIASAAPLGGGVKYGGSIYGAGFDATSDLMRDKMGGGSPFASMIGKVVEGVEYGDPVGDVAEDILLSPGGKLSSMIAGVRGSGQIIKYIKNNNKYPEASTWEKLVSSPDLKTKYGGGKVSTPPFGFFINPFETEDQ